MARHCRRGSGRWRRALWEGAGAAAQGTMGVMVAVSRPPGAGHCGEAAPEGGAAAAGAVRSRAAARGRQARPGPAAARPPGIVRMRRTARRGPEVPRLP